MSWNEFSTLLAGIMPETPLGQVVSIRSETDRDTIKNFNSAQRKLYNDWKKRQTQKVLLTITKADEKQMMKEIQNILKGAFG